MKDQKEKEKKRKDIWGLFISSELYSTRRFCYCMRNYEPIQMLKSQDLLSG